MATELTPLSRRLLVVVAILSVTLIGVVAQAWMKGDDEASFNPIALAAKRTQGISGMRFEMTGSVVYPGAPSAGLLDGSGVYDGNNERVEEEATLEFPGRGSFDIEAISTPEFIYMRSDMFGPALPEGKSWLGVKPLGGSGSSDEGTDQTRRMLQMLKATSSDFERLGRIDVRGTTTTAYRAKIDTGLYVDRLRDEGEDEAADAFEQVVDMDSSPEITAWIDDKGLLRRIRAIESREGAAGDADIDLQIEFYDFGIAPVIELPDSADVYDMTEQVRQRLGLDA